MKKALFLLMMAALCCSVAAGAAGKFGKEIVVCGDDQVIVVRPAASPTGRPEVVWRWRVAEAKGQMPEAIRKAMVPLDECKPVDKGRKLLLTSSGGAVAVIDRATRRVLFYACVPMAHSAEWLQGGKIAVALSTHPKGNSLELYDINRPDQRLYRDSLYSGHGAVWVKSRKTLYVLGYDQLRAYRPVDLKTEHPSLSLAGQWRLPGIGGHDLTSVDRRRLLVTNETGVFLFDMETHAFTPFPPMRDWQDVKAANYDAKSGQIIYTKAEESWWTHHIYSLNPAWTLTFDDINLYKVRVVK